MTPILLQVRQCTLGQYALQADMPAMCSNAMRSLELKRYIIKRIGLYHLRVVEDLQDEDYLPPR